jgi:phosphoglycerate dehydrogenase-like enzyme
MRVHYLNPPTQNTIDLIRTRIDRSVKVTHSTDAVLQDTDGTPDILIAAYPRREHLDRSGDPLRLIIPFNGLPPETRSILLGCPNVVVHRTPFASAETAEMAVTLALAAAKDLIRSDMILREGHWVHESVSCLGGSVVVIIGYGEVGRRIVGMLSGFGVSMLVVCKQPQSRRPPAMPGASLFGPCDLRNVLPLADYLIICAPLTPETRSMLGCSELLLLRDNAIVVNVGRAEIIREADLFDVLTSRPSMRAALDVWYREPRPGEVDEVWPSVYPFHKLTNVIMSPHRSWRTAKIEVERCGILSEMINVAFSGGLVPNRVDVERGY